MTLRIIFMGTPDFSVPTLKALAAAGHEVVACYTQPPRPAGRRGLDLVPSQVQRTAESLAIPVFSPTSLKGEAEQKVFEAHKANVAVVVAYGLLLPQAILDAPRQGCFNGHASLLPRWRGAAPLQRAIMAGDGETGTMVMKMEAGLDTGPVAMMRKTTIQPDMTAGMLHDVLAQTTADLMVEAMAALEAGALTLTPQSEDGVEYARKISKDEARIDWSQPAEQVHRTIMGLSPFPGAWCEMELGSKALRVKILQSAITEGTGKPGTVLDENLTVACGTGAVQLVNLQKAGSKAMETKDFLRGNTIISGTVLP